MINKDAPNFFDSANVAGAGSDGNFASVAQAAPGSVKDVERAGGLAETGQWLVEDVDTRAGSSVCGHRRNTAHHQQFVRTRLTDVDDGGLSEPEDADLFASFSAVLPADLPVDVISVAAGGHVRSLYAFDKQDWVLNDESSKTR